MQVSLESLKLTIEILFMGVDRFDFEQATRVRAQIQALALLLSGADKYQNFVGVLNLAEMRINAQVNTLIAEDTRATETGK